MISLDDAPEFLSIEFDGVDEKANPFIVKFDHTKVTKDDLKVH